MQTVKVTVTIADSKSINYARHLDTSFIDLRESEQQHITSANLHPFFADLSSRLLNEPCFWCHGRAQTWRICSTLKREVGEDGYCEWHENVVPVCSAPLCRKLAAFHYANLERSLRKVSKLVWIPRCSVCMDPIEVPIRCNKNYIGCREKYCSELCRWTDSELHGASDCQGDNTGYSGTYWGLGGVGSGIGGVWLAPNPVVVLLGALCVVGVGAVVNRLVREWWSVTEMDWMWI